MTKATETNQRSTRDLFWGRTANLSLPIRIASLLFVVLSISSMSFCQLGFWSIGVVGTKAVYLMLLLAPLAAGALLFGPLTGALLGLYTGLVVHTHSLFFPLDYYEVYYMFLVSTSCSSRWWGRLWGSSSRG